MRVFVSAFTSGGLDTTVPAIIARLRPIITGRDAAITRCSTRPSSSATAGRTTMAITIITNFDDEYNEGRIEVTGCRVEDN